nr:MAG TPA: hypothetical protein [Bacteriophage sp.]
MIFCLSIYIILCLVAQFSYSFMVAPILGVIFVLREK